MAFNIIGLGRAAANTNLSIVVNYDDAGFSPSGSLNIWTYNGALEAINDDLAAISTPGYFVFNAAIDPQNTFISNFQPGDFMCVTDNTNENALFAIATVVYPSPVAPGSMTLQQLTGDAPGSIPLSRLQEIPSFTVLGNPTGTNPDNVVAMDVGNGIAFSGGELIVDAGNGLDFNSGVLQVNAGAGLAFSGGGALEFAPIPATTLLANPFGITGIPDAVTLDPTLAFVGTSLTVAPMPTNTLLGNPTGATNLPVPVTAGPGITFNAGAVEVLAGGGLSFNVNVLTLAPIAATTLLANVTGGSAIPTSTPLGSGLSLATGSLNLANAAINTIMANPVGGVPPAPTVIDTTTVGFQGGATFGINTNVLQFISFTLTSANLIAMSATPIQVIANAPALTIFIEHVAYEYFFGGTAFTGGGTIYLQYGTAASAGGPWATGNGIPVGFLTAGANQHALDVGRINTTTNAGFAPSSGIINTPVYISNINGGFTGGNGTLTLKIWYRTA